MTLRKVFDIGLSTLFLAAIGCVLATTDWGASSSWVAEYEKREPAQWPDAPRNMADATSYLGRIGAFFSDRFGMRRSLVDWGGRIDIGLLRRSPSPQVVVGENDFLFYAGDRSIEDYRGLEQISPQEREAWKSGLLLRARWLRDQGIKYLFVVAPNKSSVYPENMPAPIRLARGPSRVEQLQQYLGDAPYFMNLTQALLGEKKRGLLYLKQDTHWSDLGASVAFAAIAGRLEINPASHLAEPEAERGSDNIRDLALVAGVTLSEASPFRWSACALPDPTKTDPAIYGPGAYSAYDIEATLCPGGVGTLLIFHDSFAERLRPFLSDTFRRVVYVSRTPSLAQIKIAVEREKPTVVIEERVERWLADSPPD